MDHAVDRGPLVSHLVFHVSLSRFCSLVTYQVGNAGHGRTVAQFVGSPHIPSLFLIRPLGMEILE